MEPMNEGGVFYLIWTVVYLGLLCIPISMGWRKYRENFRRLTDTIGDAPLMLTGKSQPWDTHGQHEVWSGERLGRQVEVRLRMDIKQIVYARIRASVARPLSDGLRLGEDCAAIEAFGFRELVLELSGATPQLRFDGHDRLGLLGDLSRWALIKDKGPMLTAQGERASVNLEPGWVELGFRDVYGAGVEPLLDLVAALVEALEAEEDRPWKELEAKHGLTRTGEILKGEVEGRPLRIQFAAGSTLITCPWDHTAYPDDLEIAHTEVMEAEGRRSIANPVLGMLVGVRARGPVELDPLLEDEELAAAILGVVHAFPGSRIRGGLIELRAPRRLRERLDEATTAVLDAARLLESAGG
jgi:hypothetical protein